jgi:hypothetical protein
MRGTPFGREGTTDDPTAPAQIRDLARFFGVDRLLRFDVS